MNDRAEQVQEQRRRRSDSYDGNDHRLEVPESLKDPNYVYRWVNDQKGRLARRTTQDDWDFVEDMDIATDDDGKNKSETTGRIRREVGITESGRPLFAYLLKKRKDWAEADFRKEMNAVKARQATALTQQDVGGEGTLAKEDPRHSYIPRDVATAVSITESKIRRAGKREV